MHSRSHHMPHRSPFGPLLPLFPYPPSEFYSVLPFSLAGIWRKLRESQESQEARHTPVVAAPRDEIVSVPRSSLPPPLLSHALRSDLTPELTMPILAGFECTPPTLISLTCSAVRFLMSMSFVSFLTTHHYLPASGTASARVHAPSR